MIIAGRLAHPTGVQAGQVRIDGERIVEVGESLGTPDVSFDDGCLVFAGFGDIHIHARDDVSESQIYKEDFRTASEAALNGGVVHVADMPNNPVPRSTTRAMRPSGRTSGSGMCRSDHAVRGNRPRHATAHETGPVQSYMGHSVGDLFFTTLAQLDAALARYRGCHVSFHCEDPILLELHKDAPTHEQKRPPECEVSATRFALEMIEKHDLTGKLCHYSVGEGIPLIRAARGRGLRVTCEVTPHHLYFDDSHITPGNRGWMQMNPPLRAGSDRAAMLAALREGLLDYLATDHAPHSLEENERGISGQPHLDTFGAFATWLMVEQKFTPQQVATFCAANPGEFVNPFVAPLKFGRLEAGYTASLTVLNLRKPHTVTRAGLGTKCGWSPFEGVTFPGSVEAVYVRGRRLR